MDKGGGGWIGRIDKQQRNGSEGTIQFSSYLTLKSNPSVVFFDFSSSCMAFFGSFLSLPFFLPTVAATGLVPRASRGNVTVNDLRDLNGSQRQVHTPTATIYATSENGSQRQVHMPTASGATTMRILRKKSNQINDRSTFVHRHSQAPIPAQERDHCEYRTTINKTETTHISTGISYFAHTFVFVATKDGRHEVVRAAAQGEHKVQSECISILLQEVDCLVRDAASVVNDGEDNLIPARLFVVLHLGQLRVKLFDEGGIRPL